MLCFQMEEEAEEEAKNMDLNKVVLRFQAFQYDKKIESYRPVTLPVDSDIVYNLSMYISTKLFDLWIYLIHELLF